ncbi:hypothetical protein D3C84_566750 [compost metagenome]
MVQRRELLAELTFRAFGGLLNVKPAFLQFQADRHRGGVLLFQFVTETGELIDPGLDAKQITALLGDTESTLPTVIAHVGHDVALPGVLAFGMPAHPHRQFVVAVGKHLGSHYHVLPHHGLDRELPAFEGRHGVFNDDARQQQRLRQRYVWVVAQLRGFFGRHRASLLTPHGRACGC